MDGVVAFVSLFLGLVSGPHQIELLVGERVAAVELLLDGRAIGQLARPPWSVRYDFGEWPEPHHLVAVAFDRDRRELGRAEQLINLPRAEAEAQFVLDAEPPGAPNAGSGARVARLLWDNVAGERPERVSVTFDEVELAVVDPARIELPPHDRALVHLLRAELTFGNGASATAQATFGGAYLDRTEARLSAVLIELPAPPLPPLAELASAITVAGAPARLLAVEKGPADLLLVRDESAREDLSQLLLREARGMRRDNKALTSRSTGQRVRQQYTPTSQARLRFVFPFEVGPPRAGRRLFAQSAEFESAEGGLLWLLGQMDVGELAAAKQQLADACAVAGQRATSRDRRRAVVLVLGDEGNDHSRWRPEHVRHYLRAIRVPLFVWTTHPAAPAARAWGEARDISSGPRLRTAYRELDAALEAQRIVWIEGRHLPAAVAVDPSPGSRPQARSWRNR